ncbi:MAG TPA: hypothetical protein VIK29_02445 [Paludibacter sp.]
MKKAFKVILMVLVATFYSCEKDNESIDSISPILSDDVLNGTIINYTSSEFDSVKVFGDNKYFIGRGSITTAGKFSIPLFIPILTKYTPMEGVIVSDTSALTGSSSGFSTYKNSEGTGFLEKCNFTSYDSTNTSGASCSDFVYADKEITIKGKNVYFGNGVFEGTTRSITRVFNLTLKKGWNEVVIKTDLYSETSDNLTINRSYTNVITTDLQWRYFPYSILFDRSNTRKYSFRNL